MTSRAFVFASRKYATILKLKIAKLNSNWQIERPYQAFGRGVAVLMILCCALLPFSDGSFCQPLNFLIAAAYSFYLPFVTIGLCLLPPIIRTRCAATVVFFPLFGFAVSARIVLLARTGQPALIHSIILPALWATGAVLLIMLIVAGGGWYAYRASNPPAI